MAGQLKSPKSRPTWSDLKRRLSGASRADLICLVQDLYAASKDNQLFLHTRFGLGDDLLQPYRETIYRWLCPDVFTNQRSSLAKAKQAITDYRRAAGRPEGLADLAVFYCESGIEQACAYGVGDDYAYLNSMVSMFREALEAIEAVAPAHKAAFRERLERVWESSDELGYGVFDDMRDLLVRYGAANDE